MKKKVEKEESFRDKLLKYINNRCQRKPRRNKPVHTKYRNDGNPVGTVDHVYGIEKNYAVMYYPRRKKLKGWQKNAR